MTLNTAPITNPLWHVGMNAKGGRRLCGGGRTAGSMYVEAGQPLGGVPIEQFLTDAPWAVELDQLHITPMGVTILEQNGVGHILDWVGSSHYPTVSDFIEEARRMGVSRKIPISTDLSLITPQSTLMLLHAQGSVVNAAEVSAASKMLCPSGVHQRGENCAGLHWVVPGNVGPDTRKLADGTYQVTPNPPGAPAAVYKPGIFMVIPISALTVVADHDGSVNLRALERVGTSGFLPDVVQL